MKIHAKQGLTAIFGCLFATLIIYGCKHDLPGKEGVSNGSGYPDDIAAIMVTRCATAGCHNAASYMNASRLRLDTWDKLFGGGANGAVVIPFDTANSSLLYYINIDPALGPVATPRMPFLNGDPQHDPALTRAEYFTIRKWIGAGAPDKDGNLPFGSNPDTRQKIYLSQQGCDLVNVIDAERHVTMRNIRVGKTDLIETPHCIRVSKDGRYAYVAFTNGLYMQKIDTRTDAIVGEVKLSEESESAQWNVLHISEDGNQIIVSDLAKGNLKIVNANTMTISLDFGSGIFTHPHGIESNAAFDTFYVTGQDGNVVYKVTKTASPKKIRVDGLPPNFSKDGPNLHEIIMTPDHAKYFVSCENTDEVRVMDAYGDSLIKVFPNLPAKPQEFALSKVRPYVFVSCMETEFPGSVPPRKGAVVVINYKTLEIVKIIEGDFYQPHGIAVDDQRMEFYVASANISTTGRAPHHVSECSGNNGWYNVYDLNTLEPVSKINYETTVAPYSADARFKN